jgi:hypothetical protein
MSESARDLLTAAQCAEFDAFVAESFPADPLAGVEIAAADEMFRVALRRWKNPLQAMKAYITVGSRIRTAVLDILRLEGASPAQVCSFMDFAGGYGRNLRFFRSVFPNAAAYLSDIDRTAVDFAASRLGATGVYSALEAKDFRCDIRYDLIVVVSLFTHLRPPVFDDWLARLVSLTSPTGRLIVTTHPITKARGSFDWEEIAPDEFYFARVSEAEGRLDAEYYGGSLVSADYVRRIVEAEGASVSRVLPGKISDHDVHVILSPEETARRAQTA